MFTRSSYYQLALIALGLLAAALIGVFFYRELYPEYRIYQNAFVELEKFRSTYTGVPPVPFKEAVKQIVILSPDKGEPTIDRCISCHVTLDIDHYSPTKIATDVNGKIVFDRDGNPVKIPNPDYIWAKLGDKIAELRDAKINDELIKAGENKKVEMRLEEADQLSRLQSVQVGEQVYDLSKVLVMHPLIGRETHPFEYHALEQYGCVTCHSGNGRGLVTDKAHGPVFDGTYEVAFERVTPSFTEPDPKNDPLFAKIFNHQPGHDLIFQTTPILVGSLMQAKCVQCHQPISEDVSSSLYNIELAKSRKEKQLEIVGTALNDDIRSLISLVRLKQTLISKGYIATIDELEKGAHDYTQVPEVLQQRAGQLAYLEKSKASLTTPLAPEQLQQQLLRIIDGGIRHLVGSEALEIELYTVVENTKSDAEEKIRKFITDHQSDNASGDLFVKAAELKRGRENLQQVKNRASPLQTLATDKQILQTLTTDIDLLTNSYQRGEQLYVSQACYACHRIAGVFRGGVGPELTRIGLSYPWYIKESIVWPQADLPTSTMPNFHLDHSELENLMTFLLAQRGAPKSISQIEYQTHIRMWEAGERAAIEQPMPPQTLYDPQAAMVVFGTEGCAACHRLKGFQSNIGFRVEQEPSSSDKESLYREHAWFKSLVPENITGSELVEVLDKYGPLIDTHIVDDVRQNSILETLNQEIPDNVLSFYSIFRYALRAKDSYYQEQEATESDPIKHAEIMKEAEEWKKRVHRVLMMYVQEYGLGRLVGPRLNWSGLFRTDQWIMEHFWKPTSHSPNSIMPVMPFDNTKFYALTHLLDTFAVKNTEELRQVWQHEGFSPEAAFQTHCAQCHGETLRGNGPVAEWIYPIPKNLRNPEFLRNLTKERAIESITHGVKGTPMPPWGEVADDKTSVVKNPVLTPSQIEQLVDWIFAGVAGATVIKESEDVPKWKYSPHDVLEEIKREGNTIRADSRTIQRGQGDKSNDVGQVFDVIPNPIAGQADQELYYIKKKYYTQDNLHAGQQLFFTNCSICHGKEAVGDGARAETMTESKPRMFTNLDWLHTHDDLRLLRSIKYGVPGTSMTPWGDYTSSLQRMQIVMYIRSLTQESSSRMQLETTLYQVFETHIKAIEEKRTELAQSIQKIEQQQQQIEQKKTQLYEMIERGEGSPQGVAELYRQEKELSSKLQQALQQDAEYQSLILRLKKDHESYRGLGENILTSGIDDGLMNELLKIIMLNKDLYSLKEGQWVMDSEKKAQMIDIGQQMVQILDEKIQSLDKEKSFERAKIPSAEVQNRLITLENESAIITKFKNKLTSFLGRFSDGTSG